LESKHYAVEEVKEKVSAVIVHIYAVVIDLFLLQRVSIACYAKRCT